MPVFLRLAVWHGIGPVLGVMIGIDNVEHSTLHVSLFGAAGDIDRVKLHRISIRRNFACHARTVPGVTVMSQIQVVTVQVNHADRILWPVSFHLVHDCISHGSHAKDSVHGLAGRAFVR